MAIETTKKESIYHPLSEILPPLSSDELKALTEDIKINSLLNPIARCEGLILDGRHRHKACRALGIEPTFIDIEPKNALQYVISANLHRRNLSESQRALVAAELALIMEISGKDSAELMTISKRSVDTAKKIKRCCQPSVIEAIRKRQITICAAEKLCDFDSAKQEHLISIPTDKWDEYLSSNGITNNSPKYIQTNIVLDIKYLSKIEELMASKGLNARSALFKNVLQSYLENRDS